jgi:hypothetical protein
MEITEHSLNSKYDFIQGYYLNNDLISDEVINHFNTQQNKTVGRSGAGFTIDKTIKDSLDLPIHLKEIQFYPSIVNYCDVLKKCLKMYWTKYPMCYEKTGAWHMTEPINIQKYKPTQGYHSWHCERSNLSCITRHLVFMTYLNSVKEGGETAWYHQKLKVKPEKGLTVIWPADWTFTHKGYTTINEDKYIITGWYNFTS